MGGKGPTVFCPRSRKTDYDYDVINKRPPHAKADKGEYDDYGRSHRGSNRHSEHLEDKIVKKKIGYD